MIMRRPNQNPQTIEGIDVEIMRLRRVLTLHEDDYDQVQEISEDISRLRALKESMIRPWEKSRPSNEAMLQRYGVIA